MSGQSIVELIKISKALHHQIGEKITDILSFSNEDKILIPATCFDIVREYQAAVIILIEQNLYHSAYVLTRSTFETFIRGAWFKNCAYAEQIDNFKQGNNPPPIHTLIANLEETALYADKILSTIHTKHWGMLCGFTHAGYEHIASKHKEGEIQANYSEEEINHLFYLINTLALFASIEMASLAKHKQLEKELYLKLKNIVAASRPKI